MAENSLSDLVARLRHIPPPRTRVDDTLGGRVECAALRANTLPRHEAWSSDFARDSRQHSAATFRRTVQALAWQLHDTQITHEASFAE